MNSSLKFKKSSFSNNYNGCVGVAKDGEKICLTNVSKESPIVDFNKLEWDAFLKGVKAGEFDEFLK